MIETLAAAMAETTGVVESAPVETVKKLGVAGEGTAGLSAESIAANEVGVAPGGFAVGGDYGSILKALDIDIDRLASGLQAEAEKVGTLERGNINRNIEGGVPERHAGHHLIPVAMARSYEVMEVLAEELGYNINRGSNGIALPTTQDLSLKTGLPLHDGKHISEYTSFVQDKLDTLQRKWENSLIEKSELMDEVAKIEDSIRSALIDDEVRLQHHDARPREARP